MLSTTQQRLPGNLAPGIYFDRLDLLVTVLLVACVVGFLVLFYFIDPCVKQRFVRGFARPSDLLQARRATRRGRGDTARGAGKGCDVRGLCSSLPVSFSC